jgi:hypothetical protein
VLTHVLLYALQGSFALLSSGDSLFALLETPVQQQVRTTARHSMRVMTRARRRCQNCCALADTWMPCDCSSRHTRITLDTSRLTKRMLLVCRFRTRIIQTTMHDCSAYWSVQRGCVALCAMCCGVDVVIDSVAWRQRAFGDALDLFARAKVRLCYHHTCT